MWKIKVWLMVLRCLFDYASGNNARWMAQAKAARARRRG
jgi:hypothetical protein